LAAKVSISAVLQEIVVLASEVSTIPGHVPPVAREVGIVAFVLLSRVVYSFLEYVDYAIVII
jgi:hypothetical protein